MRFLLGCWAALMFGATLAVAMFWPQPENLGLVVAGLALSIGAFLLRGAYE